MSTYRVQVKKLIFAPAQQIYGVLTDYRTGHPAILPKPYFEELIVEQGGQGAGTVVMVHMNVMGNKRSFHLETTEPEPGRILAEEDRENGVMTQFIVDPIDTGSAMVTIDSIFQTPPGFSGWVERIINPIITRKIYNEELQNLDDYLTKTDQ